MVLDFQMPHRSHIPSFSSRRDFLQRAGGGFGALALAAMVDAEEDKPQAATADRVLFLFMEGGPSHVDLFDPKPELTKRNGQPLPASFGRVITPMGTGGNNLLASKHKFKKFGQSGIPVRAWDPHIAECVGDIALARSCQADRLNHVRSVCQMNTGSVLA